MGDAIQMARGQLIDNLRWNLIDDSILVTLGQSQRSISCEVLNLVNESGIFPGWL
jgi:hypothetical protein